MTKAVRTRDELLEYYRRELHYLRAQSADFAARHPKVADHLVPPGPDTTDPHIEHLIQSVAFLNARTRLDLERDFPNVAHAVLDSICPCLTHPVPSMTVMELRLDPDEGKVTAGNRVARGTLLTTTAATGEPCRFQVAWNMTLWPLHVARVAHEDARTLRLDVRADGDADVGELEIEALRLHVAGDPLATMPLHDLMIASLDYIEVDSSAGVQRLPPRCLREAGFAEDESMMASPDHAHPAYGLLLEFFAFPRKFQFFDLEGLRGRLGRGRGFSIRFVFTHGAAALALIQATNFRLNCVPAINLFPATSEPIVYDQRHYEYLLVPDRRRDSTTEVHAIIGVTASDPRSGASEVIPSALAGAGDASGAPALSWTMRRAASLRPGITGSDVFIGLVDRRSPSGVDAHPVVYAKLLCTNRLLAAQVMPGTRFYGAGVAGTTLIRALYQPTAQRTPAMDGESLWAMVSLLRLNHRSLMDGRAGVSALRDLLALFAGASARDAGQIRTLHSLVARPCIARVADTAGTGHRYGHCRGTDIVLEFDSSGFAGTSMLMLAGVLARFFSLYTTANSFVRLSVCRNGETWMQWPPMAGHQALA